MSRAYDYVVVGAGSAGCVLANRLSENGRYSVCLLEAGPPDRYLWIHIPIGYAKTMFHPVYNWGFYTDPDPGMHDRKIYWPRGRGFGGCSSVNGLIYIRGQKADYDAWAAAGNEGWSWDQVLPYFRRAEHNDLGAGPTRGTEGPLWASSIKARHPLTEAFIGAANRLGVPRVDDFNSGDQEGVGYYQLTTRNGLRCSTSVAYLRPAMGRPNLTVESNAHAEKVLFEGTRAVGVQYRQGGRSLSVRANREVILSAGALQSPQLLQLSGVGPRELLQQFGIPLVHALPGVGENLQDHLQIRLMYECTQPITTNDDLNSLVRKMRMGMQWLLTRTGPLAIGINQGGLFTNVHSPDGLPDIQYHFGTLSADSAGGSVHPFSGFTMSVCQLRPQSRGYVRIKSADPMDAPSMQPNYLSAELDRQTAIAGVRYTRKLAETEPLKSLIRREYRPGPACESDAEILEFCREYGASIFHPSGTCKMGNDPLAVVDQRLRVHGVQGLRVVDCSIMPTLVSGNTNVPVVMIAEKASEMILEEANQPSLSQRVPLTSTRAELEAQAS
ncbi:choline dehydrogenase [Pseudomonas kuykendallii]|uniref:Choline dehydrogenase n=1 Tax=Pseudomonas kuykendallii TaxID=1007099 RepID=A0A1H2QY86_9PSED|nr:choline dehydrogenase [Pseudomonas kuykendallii]MCQ4271664.1 choline dehydrogenase [Pseudomonas kuykendallii]SDW11594.1 choline dehydrogenase [Pseudomonas kuykendallii]